MILEGNSSITSSSTSFKKVRVRGSATLKALFLTPKVQGTLIFSSVLPNQGYAAMAAEACPGISISGTTVM